MSASSTPAIVTFSRRSDPAFFMEWFMQRVGEGLCSVPNPFSGIPYSVSLEPEDVLLLNFWTKAPAVVAPYVDGLIGMGYRLAFFISQTSYPHYLEACVPPLEAIWAGVVELAQKVGPDALWWRYDPIIVSECLSAGWHIENFTRLCKQTWQGNTKRVIVSLAHIDGPYRSIRPLLQRACAENGDSLALPDYPSFIELVVTLTDIAREFGISLEVCCSPEIRHTDLTRVKQGACLSTEYVGKVVADLPELRPVRLRRGSQAYGYGPCRCLESRDIGVNNTCRHGCVYCYANRKR